MDQNLSELEASLLEIRDTISKGDIKGAIAKLKALNVYKEIHQIESRFNTLQRANIKGTSTQAEYNLGLNRISDALLTLIDTPPPKQKTASKNKTIYILIAILLISGLTYASYHFFQKETPLIRTEKDGKFGFVNESGAVIIPFLYDTAEGFVDSIAQVGMGNYVWTINKKGECVLDCDNIKEYEQSIKNKALVAKLVEQVRENRRQFTTVYSQYQEWIDQDVRIGNAAKKNISKAANQVLSLYKEIGSIDSSAIGEFKNFQTQWQTIETKITDAYLPNPNIWYQLKFPGFNHNFIAVDALKNKELLRIRKNPSKESFSRFKFIPHPSFKKWYFVQTVDGYLWHSIKRPSHYTDSGIELTSTKKRTITETFIIANLGDGKITIKGEGHDATGGRKHGFFSISQKGNNKRPDGSPLHLWEYLRGGDQQLQLIEVE